MIRIVDRFLNTDCKTYFSKGIFNVVDTETMELIEKDNIIENEDYYLFHNGSDSDRYKRVVALGFVNICLADKEDDLSKYGFILIGQSVSGLNRWYRK